VGLAQENRLNKFIDSRIDVRDKQVLRKWMTMRYSALALEEIVRNTDFDAGRALNRIATGVTYCGVVSGKRRSQMARPASIRLAVLVASVCLLGSRLGAQDGSGSKTPLAGAWKIIETSAHGPYLQPSLYLFTARHFSRMSTLGGNLRPLFEKSNPSAATAAEKIAAYDTMFANTGTYDVSGDVITFNSVLAKLPNAQGTSSPMAKLRFKIKGNTLTLTQWGNESVFLKLTRVE
jgi:hypothetical protein